MIVEPTEQVIEIGDCEVGRIVEHNGSYYTVLDPNDYEDTENLTPFYDLGEQQLGVIPNDTLVRLCDVQND